MSNSRDILFKRDPGVGLIFCPRGPRGQAYIVASSGQEQELRNALSTLKHQTDRCACLCTVAGLVLMFFVIRTGWETPGVIAIGLLVFALTLLSALMLHDLWRARKLEPITRRLHESPVGMTDEEWTKAGAQLLSREFLWFGIVTLPVLDLLVITPITVLAFLSGNTIKAVIFVLFSLLLVVITVEYIKCLRRKE